MTDQKRVLDKFPTSNQVVNIVNTGGGLVNLLGQNNSNCSLINNNIRLVKALGSGVQGIFYLISIDGKPSKIYGVKESFHTPSKMFSVLSYNNIQFFTFVNNVNVKYGTAYSSRFIASLNNIESKLSETIVNKGGKILFPRKGSFQVIECKLNGDGVYTNWVNGQKNQLNTGDYICEEEWIESGIGSLVSTAIEQNSCPHFIESISFATCDDYRYYNFMAKLNPVQGQIERSDMKQCIGTGKVELRCLMSWMAARERGQDAMISIGMQILFTLAYMQERWKIAHQDLHLLNVFITAIGPDDIWRGQRLMDQQFFRYTIDGKIYYCKNMGFLVKLGDWGFGAKYSQPRMLRKDLVNNSDEGLMKWQLPNTYTPNYDVLYCFQRLAAWYYQHSRPDLASSFVNIMLNASYNQHTPKPEFKTTEHAYDAMVKNIWTKDKNQVPNRPKLAIIQAWKWTAKQIFQKSYIPSSKTDIYAKTIGMGELPYVQISGGIMEPSTPKLSTLPPTLPFPITLPPTRPPPITFPPPVVTITPTSPPHPHHEPMSISPFITIPRPQTLSPSSFMPMDISTTHLQDKDFLIVPPNYQKPVGRGRGRITIRKKGQPPNYR